MPFTPAGVNAGRLFGPLRINNLAPIGPQRSTATLCFQENQFARKYPSSESDSLWLRESSFFERRRSKIAERCRSVVRMHVLTPVPRRQDDSPDVHRSFEFDAVMRRVVGLDIHHARRTFFPREVDVNHDVHARLQGMRARDESAVKINDDGFALAGKGNAGTEDLNGDLKRDTRTATMLEKWRMRRHERIGTEIVHPRGTSASEKRGQDTVE